MGFRVKPVKRLKGPQYKILFEWFDGQERKTRSVTKDEWLQHGFRFDMSIDQAKAHMKALNAQERLSQKEKRRQKAYARVDEVRLAQSALFPPEYVTEFEQIKLGESPKARSYWNKAREIIWKLQLPLREWEPKKELFYRAFLEQEMSPAYVEKVLPLINRWGEFYSDKCDKAFRRIPPPHREWAKRLRKAYNRREEGRGNKKSAALKPITLYRAEHKFLPAEYRWLYLSVWFGLRPGEVDLLSKSSGEFTWKIREVAGEKRLYVFQPKNEGDEDKEWKYIPCQQPEQVEGLKLVGKELKRPSQFKMFDRFGGTITLYGGRQGFVKLMKFFQAEYHQISQWLGHAELDRTYRDYTKRLEEDYTPSDVYLEKAA